MRETRRLTVRMIRLSDEARLPGYAKEGDAGMDLISTEPVMLSPGARQGVGTDLCMAVPDGFVGLVVPRSGLALESGLTVLNAPGVIDSGYRGEVRVIVANLGTETVKFRKGLRIAQLVIVPIPRISVEEVAELEPTARGGEGFGSTGL